MVTYCGPGGRGVQGARRPDPAGLLDELFREDGQTLSALEERFAMTRFGVMKHLKQLEEAGLVVTRRRGREKLHFLNPVPIRLVHDRWVSKYAEPWAAGLSDLKTETGEPHGEGLRDLHPHDARAALGGDHRSRDPGASTTSARGVTSDWTPGSRFEMGAPEAPTVCSARARSSRSTRRAGSCTRCVALWGDDVKAEGTSRVTWEIEPVGDSCRLLRHARPAARGRQRPALRRLADDPLRA